MTTWGAGHDNRHGVRGAAWLAQWFPPAVTEPVRLHVAAKRYLCAVEPSYFALQAKDPSSAVPGFEHFRPVLAGLAAPG